jgi:hypothetical protein
MQTELFSRHYACHHGSRQNSGQKSKTAWKKKNVVRPGRETKEELEKLKSAEDGG